MTALTTDRNTPYRPGRDVVHPVAASVQIFAGALVMLDSDGNAIPAKAAANLKIAGRAEQHIDNRTGVVGDKTVAVQRGVFRFENDATNAVTRTHIGTLAYAVDDQTVCNAAGKNSKSIAGLIIDLDDDGVWIDTTQSGATP
ncbi:MAG: hypothetical protein AAF442_04970 [Pseudomonadota bacterium]